MLSPADSNDPQPHAVTLQPAPAPASVVSETSVAPIPAPPVKQAPAMVPLIKPAEKSWIEKHAGLAIGVPFAVAAVAGHQYGYLDGVYDRLPQILRNRKFKVD